ncbi:MAG TPA: hypothetical protein VFT55_12075, partial [Planctomycetota bacterium]|nr:hypothetical protein [Planctomycetota bacterium]
MRILGWFAALSPALAAVWWASFGARFPEPWLDRRALGEVTPRWDLAEWADLQSEPAHVFSRLVHLGALQVPGATMSSVVWVNALLAVAIVAALSSLARRTFAIEGLGQQVGLAVAGLLVAAPAFGATWLYGERAGVLLAPFLFLTALSWLQGERWFRLRASGAILLAALAPFCHGHGALVFLALLPALAAAANRAGSKRTPAWIVACLLVGNVAAAASLRSAGGIAVEGVHWADRLGDAPLATLAELLRVTGSACLDPLPRTNHDQLVLGAACWLLPFVMRRLGDRSEPARAAAAPWWSCFWFGLALVVWNAVRYDLKPPVGTLREAMFGVFLLPAGAAGVLAARCGRVLLPVFAGALAMLALQDWHSGIEALRLARMRAEHTEAALMMPVAIAGPSVRTLPVRGAAELQILQQRGWVPTYDEGIASVLAAAMTAPPTPQYGSCAGGQAGEVVGTVRSSLTQDTVQWVAVMVSIGEGTPEPAGVVQPDFAGRGRDVDWIVKLSTPLAEGTHVRAIGLFARSHETAVLGPTY